MRRRHRIAGALAVLLFAGAAHADPKLYEFTPKPDDATPIGKLQVVGAKLPAEAVRFIVKDLTVQMPLQFTLAADDPSQELTLEVFKDSWEAPILSLSTAPGDGAATLRFRTGDHAALAVRGPAGAGYQLLCWVGPEMKPVPVPPLVTPEEYEARTGKKTVYTEGAPAPPAPEPASPPTEPEVTTEPSPAAPGPVTPPAPPPPAPPTDAGDGGPSTTIVVLLGAILVALVVIAVLLARGRGGAKAAGLLLALALLGAPATARAQDPGTVPGTKQPEDWNQRINAAAHRLRETLSGFSGNDPFNPNDKFTKGVNELATATHALLLFMEHFGLIDPREAAVQPDYNPSDAPPLPVRGFSDPRGRARGCLRDYDVARDLQKWQKLLEDLRVIYKQTMLETGRIIELADAAAGMSSLAKLKWTIDKSNPNEAFNKSKAEFFATYDDAYGKLIDRVNRTLLEIAKCEQQVYGVENWYELYGLPYYLYMRDRYKRAQ